MASGIQRQAMLKRKEAAQILGVKGNTLAVWACRGIGPIFHRIGRSVRYDLKDLERYIEAGRVLTRDQK